MSRSAALATAQPGPLCQTKASARLRRNGWLVLGLSVRPVGPSVRMMRFHKSEFTDEGLGDNPFGACSCFGHIASNLDRGRGPRRPAAGPVDTRHKIAVVAATVMALGLVCWATDHALGLPIDDGWPGIKLVETNAVVTNPDHPQSAGGLPASPLLPLLTGTDPPETLEEHIAVEKVFDAFEPLVMIWLRNPDVSDLITLEEIVINATCTPWTDSHIELRGGAVFVDPQDPVIVPDPVVTWVTMDFDPPLPWAAGAPALTMGDLNGVPSPGDVLIDIPHIPVGGTFEIVQYPTYIPEPVTLLLLEAPAGVLIWHRRRERSLTMGISNGSGPGGICPGRCMPLRCRHLAGRVSWWSQNGSLPIRRGGWRLRRRGLRRAVRQPPIDVTCATASR